MKKNKTTSKSINSLNWDSSNHLRDVLDGKFLAKPQKRIDEIIEKREQKDKELFKKEIANLTKKVKLDSKIKKKGL
jgi:hypothetical protein